MNKQELIDKYEGKRNKNLSFELLQAYIDFIRDLEQLDEPQPVKVPQFVADYIEWAKEEDYHLLGAMNNMNNQGNWKGLKDWLYTDDNIETFARAWLDGYEVEEEKKYLVSLKNGQPLTKTQSGKAFYFNQNIIAGNYKFTRKELEEAGFGWVFDCEGIEIEEVE